MGFFGSLFESFSDKVSKISDPDELIGLWKEKKNEDKASDQAIIEARLADVLSGVSDLKEFERLFVLVDKRAGDWLPQIKAALLSDDDSHLLALEDKGDYIKNLVALCEAHNTFCIVLVDGLKKEMGGGDPDLVPDFMEKAMFEIASKKVSIMNVLEARLLEILKEHVDGVNDINVMSGIFDLAGIGASGSDFRVLKSREVALRRLCEILEGIDDPAWLKKDISVPEHPRIKEALDAMYKRMF